MGLQHLLNLDQHDTAELARIGWDDLDHAINHLLRVEVTKGDARVSSNFARNSPRLVMFFASSGQRNGVSPWSR